MSLKPVAFTGDLATGFRTPQVLGSAPSAFSSHRRSFVNRRRRQHLPRWLDRRAARVASWSPAIPDAAASPTKKPPINRWEHRYLGEERFPEALSALEIEHFFTLDEDELVSVRERRGPLNRLALALQIGFLKMTGRTLNSVELIPPQILDHLGRQVDCAAPRLASIRAFYRRRHRTLFEHHASAFRLLGRSELTPHAERGLVAYLRREAAAVFDEAELVARARSWLVEHQYLLLRERHIRRLAIAARRHQQQALFKLIAAAVPAERDLWVPRLLAPIEDGGVSRREWLLGRPARSEWELVALYAALMGLGSDLSIAELVRMVPSLAADSLGQMMLKIEGERRLRPANDAVLRFMREHPIAALWGRELFASADMMSLEATRYLWSAHLDPRRRTYAVGTYAHVLDQWGILYDLPIVLNRRQAGAAIEGALRQRQVERIERVAVDTHGFTHFAMALAKLVGFDLCPRLAKLKKRKLYLPKGLEIPQVLRPIVAETVSRRAIARGWEGLLRLGASVKHGWDSATAALDRFGSAAAGDPVCNAGDGLGRLLRTLYLCDYLSNPAFRLEILDLLNQGEAVHSLQRAIHNRMITAKHGRTMEELGTISGALTLLGNIVMAWNTHRIQAMIDAAPSEHPDELMRRLAPIGHKHINMRGILTFDLGRHRSNLLRQAPSAATARVPS